MKRGALLGFLVLVLAFLLALLMARRAVRPEAVNFFFTGDTQGFLVPCGCKTVPAGGLARRASALASFEDACVPEPVVPVEIAHGFSDRGPGREQLNAAMGAFFQRTGTLVGLGSYDLLLGPEALRLAVPGVATFLSGREGQRSSKEFLLGGWSFGPFHRGGKRLRLVFLSQSAPGGAPLADPLTVLARELREHPADGVVVTGQLAPETVAAILKVEPAVLLVAAQWGTTVTSQPQEAGSGRWLLYVGDRGRRMATARVAFSSGTWQIMPQVRYLGPDSPSDPAVEREVAAVLKEVGAANARSLDALAAAPAPESTYLGAEACARCHAEAHAKWRLSPHAKATKDLAIDHQERNPDCLVCHATGLGKPGGYPRDAVALDGVQCEACHGPGQGHPPRRLMAAPASRETCEGCHTQRDSPMFDAEGFWRMVEHG